METIKNKLLTSGLSESSVKNYMRQLKFLNSDADFTNLNFLNNSEKIIKRVQSKSENLNTQRSYMTCALSVLKRLTKKTELIKEYELYVSTFNQFQEIAPNTMTEKQEEAWMDWKDIEKIYKELSVKADKAFKSDADDYTKFAKYLDYMVLSLYVLICPRRNMDYVEMYVKDINEDDEGSEDKDKNYLILVDGKPKEFVFNKFKTVSTYGTQSVKITVELATVIQNYLKVHPLRAQKDYPFLVDTKGHKFKLHNVITKILNRVFARNIGPTMLRHIFLTHKYGVTYKERSIDALEMGHSIASQHNYILQK